MNNINVFAKFCNIPTTPIITKSKNIVCENRNSSKLSAMMFKLFGIILLIIFTYVSVALLALLVICYR